MNALTRSLARFYFSHVPVEKGKWRVWTSLGPLLAADARGEVDASLKDGLRARLVLGEYMQRFTYYWSQWDPNEAWVLKRLLRPGDTFIDAGANFGYFTLLGSRLVGPEGRVYAFEPSPPTAAWLKRNLSMNQTSNVTLHECAVSSAAGAVRITKTSSQNSGVNSIRTVEDALDAWEVPAVSLDEVIPDSPVRLMKVDIEGAELLLVRGFERHLRRGLVANVVCEIHDNYLRELGSSAHEFFEMMCGHGFTAFSFARQRLVPVARLEADTDERRDQVNLLFSRPV